MIGWLVMSKSFAFRRAPVAWLFTLALASVPVAAALAEDSVPAPAAADLSPEGAGAAITPGPPSPRFT